MSHSESLLSPDVELSLDDCDALLKFPFKDFAEVHQVKEEVKDPDLPELGTSANLSLDGNYSFHNGLKGTASKLDGSTTDPKELEACLASNKKLQQKIIQTMAKLVEALGKNKSKQEELVQQLKAEEKFKNPSSAKCTVVKPIALFASPYFRDIKGRSPPDNEDTIAKVKNNDITAYNHPPRPWTMHEKDQLVEGVGSNALSYVLRPYKAKRDFLKSKIKDKNATDEDIKNMKKQIIYVERKMKMESERLFKDLVGEAKDQIDWLMISATYMEGNRNEDECELLWNNYLSPFVNKERFTEKEDAHLKKLVEKYKGKNWDAITAELQTNRSVIQVFERYQTKLNTQLCKKYWTPEEDKLLLSLVETYKIGKYINWNKIKLDGRSRWQMINRYERTLSEDIRREPWSPAEDAMLYACVSKFGCKWTSMQDFFIGRPLYYIRERYVNTLDPDLKMGNWTKSEDMELIKLIKKFGYGRWSYISRHLTGRTDNMVYCRAKRLVIHSLAQASDDDINWECENIQKLTSMLKPVANSKNCLGQNARLKKTQSKATETLKAAVTKIAPFIDEKIDLEAMDFSAVSLPTLHLLYKELGSCETQTTSAKEFTPKYFHNQNKLNRPFCKTTNSRHKRLCKDDGDRQSYYEADYTDEESASDETDNKDGLRFSEMERIWLKKVLEYKFNEEALILYHNNPKKKKCICLSKKETLESSIYLSFLKKELLCKNYLDEEDIEFVLGDDEYNITLARVTRFFIQPPISSNEMIVLAPNFSTLHGLDMLLSTENRLRRTANFVDHSMPYIRFVTGFSGEPPRCLVCSSRRGSGANPLESTYEEVVKDMKSSMLVIDEVFQREAMLETRTGVDPQSQCRCRELTKSKGDVDILAKRFISMFIWPFLLVSTGVSKEQEELIYYVRKKDPFVRCKKDPDASRGRGRPPQRRPYWKANNGIKRENGTDSTDPVRKKRPYVKKEKPIKQESGCESAKMPIRRSSRVCVRNRKSFAEVEEEEE